MSIDAPEAAPGELPPEMASDMAADMAGDMASDTGPDASEGGAVADVGLPELTASELAQTAVATAHRDLRLLADVSLELSVQLGRARLPLRDLLALAPGSVLELDRTAGEPVDVLVNGRLIARGEVVVVDGDFGVRISEISDPQVPG